MSYVFISHASVDKHDRVAPLVEAMLMAGEAVWVDRPGSDGLGFSQEYISAHGIEFLGSGSSYSVSIREAIRASGAVLACLTRATQQDRRILHQELLIAQAAGKLVACVLDDLGRDELDKTNHGLLDLRHLQAPRIDPIAARNGARWIAEHSGKPVPADHAKSVESLLNLIASIDRVRVEPRKLRATEIATVAPRIRGMPVGPPLKSFEVPRAIREALADHIRGADPCFAIVQQGNELVAAAVGSSPMLPKFRVRQGELKPVAATSGDEWWDHLLNRTGLKGRFVVAAMLLTPIARWAFGKSGLAAAANDYLDALAQSGNTALADYLTSYREHACED